MLYRNTKTNRIIDVSTPLVNGFWEKVEEEAKASSEATPKKSEKKNTKG